MRTMEEALRSKFGGREPTVHEVTEVLQGLVTEAWRDPFMGSIKVEHDPNDPTRVLVSGLPEQLQTVLTATIKRQGQR